MRDLFEEFISSANKSIAIKLVCNESDLKEDSDSQSMKEFVPEFCHQLFGENEQIFGYKDLRVKLYYSSAKLNCYLSLDFAEKVSKEETDGIEADNVLKIIADKLEIQLCQSLDEFRSLLSKETQFKPYGELIQKFSIDDNIDGNQTKRDFEIYLTDISTPGFGAYHQRMQTFLWWFIDAASYIDTDDDKWQYFLIFEKRSLNPIPSQPNGHSVNKEEKIYCFVGYSTVYRYYAYPDRMRPRISQFIILPPFQRRGLGTRLLEAIYLYYKTDKVIDITVEDPSDNFTRIRDFVDSKYCRNLMSFSAENLKKGFNREMSEEAQKEFKISQKQSRRVYEVLRFRCTDKSNPEEYKAFRLDVKQRLNAPTQKQIQDYDKIEKRKIVPPQELSILRQTSIPTLELRIENLDKQYKEMEEEFQAIVERLAQS